MEGGRDGRRSVSWMVSLLVSFMSCFFASKSLLFAFHLPHERCSTLTRPPITALPLPPLPSPLFPFPLHHHRSFPSPSPLFPFPLSRRGDFVQSQLSPNICIPMRIPISCRVNEISSKFHRTFGNHAANFSPISLLCLVDAKTTMDNDNDGQRVTEMLEHVLYAVRSHFRITPYYSP